MGFYTKFNFTARLNDSTPSPVIDLLNRVINERDLGHDKMFFKSEDVFKPEFDHCFFKCGRWYMLFLSCNFDDDLKGGVFQKKKDVWSIKIETEFKNYDGEIDLFIHWISPFIRGRKKKQYLGWSQTETGGSGQDHYYLNR